MFPYFDDWVFMRLRKQLAVSTIITVAVTDSAY